jgi:sulfatase modifying factor 1
MNRYHFQLNKRMILVTLVSFLLSAGIISREQPERLPIDSRIGTQVYIRAGQYYTGSSDQSDGQSLTLREFAGFHIDIHPVTNFQYLEFMNRSGFQPRGKFDPDAAKKQPWLPATGLTHEDAGAYADFSQKRLPTEWEWEIAARSLRSDIIYATGTHPTMEAGNFFRYKQTNGVTPVFTYPPNKIGIYGMAGNVFEWTASLYPVERLRGPYSGKYRIMVLRGGAWTNIPHDVRVTTRTPFPASRSLEWLGFRCVSDKRADG